MKKLLQTFKKKVVKKPASQQELLEFVKDEKNIKKAAEGSMQKRLDLIKRVELKKKNA